MKPCLALLGMLPIVRAAPATITSSGTKFNATFEGIPGSSALPELFPVPTPYFGLAYPGFNVFTTNILSTLKPSSGKQTADSFSVENIAQGVPAPTISTDYTGSKVSKFTLSSLTLGCVVSSQTGLLTSKCTVEFTGSKRGLPSVKTQCAYGGGAVPATCNFPSDFKDLIKVTFAFISVSTTPLTTITQIDDVVGVTFP